MTNHIRHLILLIILSSTLFAQNSFGIKGGVIKSELQNTDYDPYTGFTFGILKEFDIAYNFSLQLELDYSQRGADLGEVNVRGIYLYPDVYLYKVNIKLGYIELPVLLKYNIHINENFQLGPYAGASIGIPSGKKSTVDRIHPIGEADSVDYEYFLIDEGGQMKGDFATNLGIALKMYDHYIFDIRYFHSFNSPGDIRLQIPIEYKFDSFIMTVGYLF